jgi:lipoyl(octanoyl) transferase
LAAPTELRLRQLGRADYVAVWNAMRRFTDVRTAQTPDELWLVEHPPVYTMGLKGRDGTLADIDGIPLVYTDRGGDITYHGPGQAVLYPLLDLVRLGIGIRTLVQTLEQSVIDHLAQHHVVGARRVGAPGVYVDDNKIAALGLRVRNGRTYHGLSFNVDMDLAPFSRIDPCGYQGLGVTQLVDLGIAETPAASAVALALRLAALLGYNAPVNFPATGLTDPITTTHE